MQSAKILLFYNIVIERKCMECPGCKTVIDCGTCKYCKDKRKFGGPGIKRKVVKKGSAPQLKYEFHYAVININYLQNFYRHHLTQIHLF